MHPRSLTLLRAAVLLCVIGLVAACSNAGASAAPTTGGNATTGPATAAPPTEAPPAATETPNDQVNGSLTVGLPPRIGRASRWNEAAPEMSAGDSAKSAVSMAGTKPSRVADLRAGRR